MAVLAGIGHIAGLSFFARIKRLSTICLLLCRIHVWAISRKIMEANWGNTAVDIIVAVSLAAWIFIMTRYNLYTLPDNGLAIVLRVLSSITGCIAVCGMGKGLFAGCSPKSMWAVQLSRCENCSLEIYLTHDLLLTLLKSSSVPQMKSIQGIGLVTVNYLLTVALTILIVKALSTSKSLKMILYGKKG